MKAKTIAHCFGLLAILLSVGIIGEFLFAVFTGRVPQSLHKTFPLVTFPALIDKLQHPEGRAAAKEKLPLWKITLKNGRIVTGEKISEEADEIQLKVDGSVVGFMRSEIARSEEVFSANT